MVVEITAAIEAVFPDGEWASEEEYLIQCQFCGDAASHNHLYINVVKRLFHCYYCGEAGHLSSLLKQFGGNVVLADRIMTAPAKRKVVVEPTDFNSFLPLNDGCSSKGWTAIHYLTSRGISRTEIELYQLRYAEEGRYQGRIIIPIFEADGEEVVCFTSRSYSDQEPKYLMPHKGETRLTCAEVLYGQHWVRAYRKVVLVEGAFDAMAVNRKLGNEFCGVALMSKKMNPPQLTKLLRLDEETEFFVALDPDAMKESLLIAKALTEYGRNVRVVRLEGGDPASLGATTLAAAVAEAGLYGIHLKLEWG